MDTQDTAARLALYRFFIDHGRPPTPPELARSLDLPLEQVENSLLRLAEEHVIVLAPGTPYIWMANPLSALPTPFRVETAGREWFGNCIWDALGIIAMLGDGEGRVATTCPDCLANQWVEVVDGAITHARGVVHYGVPARRWWDDIGFT